MANQTGWPRNLLRTIVLKTNPYPPFRQCNRWPYRLAIERVVRAFCGLPGLQTLYLRHGLASSSWIAGLSDIDFAVVLKAGLSAQQEFDLLYELRARYRRIQRWFPMLGELDVLSEEDLALWISLTNSTPFPRSWTLLHGSPVFDPTTDCSPDWRSRALTEALGFYVFELWPYFSRPDSYLCRADIDRRLRKIERLLAPALEAPGGRNPGPQIPERIAAMLRDLEKVAALVDPMDTAVQFEGLHVRIPYCGASIAVCRDGVTAEEIAQLLAAEQAPVILTARLFGYFARKYNPYDYDYLYQGGANAVVGLRPPVADDFAAYLRSRLAHALLFTRGPEMFPASDSVDADDLHAEAKRLMGMRLLSEKQCVVQDWLELEARWKNEYPEPAAALSQVLTRARNRERGAQREAFEFFRSFVRTEPNSPKPPYP